MRPAALAPLHGNQALLERLSFDLQRAQKLEDTRRIEAEMERKFAGLFKLQGKLFLGALEGMRSHFTEAPGEPTWGPAWDRVGADTNEGFLITETEGVGRAMTKGATRLSDDLDLGISFDLKNPRATAWLDAHAAEMVTGVDETSKSYIRTVMTQAVDEGWSYDRTAKTLTERFAQFAVGMPQQHIDSRAHLIAVTESAFGYEKGNALMAQDLAKGGIPLEKHWLTVGDERVDEEQCGPNEDEGWIPLEDAFQDGSSEPPAHPACRCTTQYQVSGTEAEVA